MVKGRQRLFGTKKRLFRLMFHGRNVLVRDDSDNSIVAVGFYATRVVKAADLQSAREIGTELIKRDLEKVRFRSDDSHGVPVIEIEEVDEMSKKPSPRPAGFTFYLENPED